jgi:predicted dehydrogenase
LNTSMKNRRNERVNRFSRRDFVRGSAALAAGAFGFPYVIRSDALGKGARPPASERITVAHIGVGGMGGGHVKGFVLQELSQSVATCDPVKQRRDKSADYIDEHYGRASSSGAYRGCARYNDFRELLARDDIDAVVIATPCHWHVPIALAAVRAGKDVYVEKPLGLSLEWDKALRETVKCYGNVVQYGTQQRSSRSFRYVCELVRNARIGRLENIVVWCAAGQPGGSLKPDPVPEGFDYDLWLGPAPKTAFNTDRCFKRGKNWISDYALGFIAGWGAHPLDIAQWGNDADDTSPVEYEGTGVFPTDGLFDTATAWDVRCRYANGVNMHFMSYNVAKPILEKYGKFAGYGTMFIGTEGWLNVDRGRVYASDPALLKSVIAPNEIRLPRSTDHKHNFLECIKTRSEPVSPVRAAVRSDTISHLSEIAIRLRRKIRWDPKNEVIIGDEEANRMLSRSMRSPWHL